MRCGAARFVVQLNCTIEFLSLRLVPSCASPPRLVLYSCREELQEAEALEDLPDCDIECSEREEQGGGSGGSAEDDAGTSAAPETPPSPPRKRTRSQSEQELASAPTRKRTRRGQQQQVPVPLQPPPASEEPANVSAMPGRPMRAAAQGLHTAMQAVLAQGMPAAASPPRPPPRRAAAAGVDAAARAVTAQGMPADMAESGGMQHTAGAGVQAAAARSSRGRQAAGPTLDDLAEVAAAEISPAAAALLSDLVAAQDHVLAGQAANHRRIEGQRRPRGEAKDFQCGSLVYLTLPMAVRSALDPPKLLCRVVDVGSHGLCLLRCNSGLLDSRFPTSQLSSAPSAAAASLTFEDVRRRGVPKVSLAAAAAAQHRGGDGVKCACKKGCSSRCACRLAGRVCGRHCKCTSGHGVSCSNLQQ